MLPLFPFNLFFTTVEPLLLLSQGTASPTTPMATNAPISPSPTGTVTSAPTSVGITSYIKVGEGSVSSYLLNIYDRFLMILTIFFSISVLMLMVINIVPSVMVMG